ncbi:MAG: hypothetical protein IKP04_06890 [Candidatus Methanomethylophilaceae archaeon]|nr:hypothetical protein [Candidatus Methanomethylophilaceae archaeon]
MREERPYIANYAIGMIMVMGVNMAFTAISCYLYPDLYRPTRVTYEMLLAFYIGMTVWEVILAITLFIGSGLSYKLCVLSLFLILALTLADMFMQGGSFAFDIWLQIVLSALAIVLLLQKPVRAYYHNWSLGTLGEWEL